MDLKGSRQNKVLEAVHSINRRTNRMLPWRRRHQWNFSCWSLRTWRYLMHFNLSCFSFTAFLLPPPSIPRSQGVGMANKGPSYGLSRQVQDKIESKYDPELEQILVEWISRQCGSNVGRPEPGKLGFQAWLKNGCVSTNLHVFDSLLFYNV